MPAASTVVSASNIGQRAGQQDSQGLYIGNSASDLIGFYGATPIPQPSGGAEAASTRGGAPGLVAVFSTTQTPSTIAGNTTVEKSFTVQTGTGYVLAPATGDIIYMTKPTAQAGLGYGNVRVSAANTVLVTYSNYTAGTITIAAAQVNVLAMIRGMPTLSAALTPAAVPASTTMEQQFTVAGLQSGQMVRVVKPSVDTGLDVCGARIVSNNVLGITYGNTTTGALTPTAETYTIQQITNMDALNTRVQFGYNVGAVGAISAGLVVSAGSTALAGVLASDSVVGVYKPTAQAAGTNAAFFAQAIPTADTLTMYYGSIGSGGTPTSSEVYTIEMVRLAPLGPFLAVSSTLTPTSVAANTTAEQTFAVSGLSALATMPVFVNKPSWTPGLGVVGCRMTSAGNVGITFCNATATAIVPPAETYLVGTFQNAPPGAGNSVWQDVSSSGGGILTSAMRSALVSLGLIAGA